MVLAFRAVSVCSCVDAPAPARMCRPFHRRFRGFHRERSITSFARAEEFFQKTEKILGRYGSWGAAEVAATSAGAPSRFLPTLRQSGRTALKQGHRACDNAAMRVTADEGRRVVLPSVEPGDNFELQTPADGTFILIRLESASARPAGVKLEKRGAFTVGVLDVPIDEQALKAALAEFP